MRNPTKIFSLYGQIEEVVARAMVEEGKLPRIINAADIPPTALVNEDGRIARCAVIVPRCHEAEFENRIKELYA